MEPPAAQTSASICTLASPRLKPSCASDIVLILRTHTHHHPTRSLATRRARLSQRGQCWVAWAKSFITRSLKFSMLLKIFNLQTTTTTNQMSEMEWTPGQVVLAKVWEHVGLRGQWLWAYWKNLRASASLSSGCSDSFSQFTSSADLHGTPNNDERLSLTDAKVEEVWVSIQQSKEKSSSNWVVGWLGVGLGAYCSSGMPVESISENSPMKRSRFSRSTWYASQHVSTNLHQPPTDQSQNQTRRQDVYTVLERRRRWRSGVSPHEEP